MAFPFMDMRQKGGCDGWVKTTLAAAEGVANGRD